jgi:hypothetical protein
VPLGYPPPFMDLETLSDHICSGQSTIEKWVRTGLIPAPKKIGGKRLWCWKEVEKHLKNGTGPAAVSPDAQAEAIRNATRQAAQSGNY